MAIDQAPSELGELCAMIIICDKNQQQNYGNVGCKVFAIILFVAGYLPEWSELHQFNTCKHVQHVWILSHLETLNSKLIEFSINSLNNNIMMIISWSFFFLSSLCCCSIRFLTLFLSLCPYVNLNCKNKRLIDCNVKLKCMQTKCELSAILWPKYQFEKNDI